MDKDYNPQNTAGKKRRTLQAQADVTSVNLKKKASDRALEKRKADIKRYKEETKPGLVSQHRTQMKEKYEREGTDILRTPAYVTVESAINKAKKTMKEQKKK